MSNTTAVAPQDGRFSSFMLQNTVKQKINDMMGSKKGETFVTSIVTVVSKNPTLAECEPSTILSAGMEGAALDFPASPVLGYFYMVPYNDTKNNRKVAQFQIGYKGYIQLAIRSGQYRRINVIALKEGELISYNRLTEEIFTKLIDDDDVRESMPTVGYYAMFELTNGFIKTMYWSKSKMERHADKYSQAFKLDVYKKIEAGQIPKSELWKREYSSYWYQDFENMAFKTMLRQLLSKWGVMSVELQRAFDADMSVIDGNGNASYIDNDILPQGGDGKADEPNELHTLSDEDFAKELKAWAPIVKKGKKTPEDIINQAKTANTLSDEQIAKIMALPGPGEDNAVVMAHPDDVTALKKLAEEMTISEAAIAKKLGLHNLDNLTIKELEAADAYVRNPS